VCANATSLFGRETATLSSTVAANSPVFVVPKARNSTGPYALVVTATSACSNRVINAGEQCDDGNATVGDGCDASCAYTAPLIGTCDLPVGGRPIIVGLGTQTYRPTSPVHANARDIPCGTAGVREFVTFFEPEVSGRLQLDGGPNEALAVYAVGCARAPLACAGVGALSTLNVTAGTTYALVVESPVRPAEFTLSLSRCGNGDIEGAEQCDDGNAVAGDGCTPACVREPSCQLAVTAGTTFASPARPPFARCAAVPVTGTLPALGPSITSHVTLVTLAMGDRITATLARSPVGPTAWGVEILPESAGASALQGNTCNASRAFACASDAGAASNSVTWVSPSGGNYFVRMFSTSVAGATLNGLISVVRYPSL
jgi:cysteine-rich repeat protein